MTDHEAEAARLAGKLQNAFAIDNEHHEYIVKLVLPALHRAAEAGRAEGAREQRAADLSLARKRREEWLRASGIPSSPDTDYGILSVINVLDAAPLVTDAPEQRLGKAPGGEEER